MPHAGGFRINAPLVAVQEIEGEAILINFDTGCYYSANATGAVLLELAQRGASVAAMVQALASRCAVPESRVVDPVSAFFTAAQDGGLVVPSDGADIAAPSPTGDPAMEFVAPQLEKFDDLQDLLMLDPIHDVDQVGWPMQAPHPDASPAPPASPPA